MPVRWRGVFLGFGFFFSGIFVGASLDRAIKAMEKLEGSMIVQLREDITTLEAQGDSASFDKAQRLKIRLNKLETQREAWMKRQEARKQKEIEKSFDWSYSGSASASFGTSPFQQTIARKEEEGEKIIEGAILDAIRNLDEKGDDESREMASYVKDRLQRIKRKQQVRMDKLHDT